MTPYRLPGAATLAALVLAALIVLLPATAVHASTFEVGDTRIETNDPTGISFRLPIETSAGLESVQFNYKVLNPDGNIGGSGDAQFASTSITDATFELATITAQRYIPVGSEFVIQWELTDKDGVTFVTDEEQFTFLDARYDWKTRAEGNVTVYWYGNDDTAASAAFVAAASSIADAEALLQTSVPYPIKVVVWRSEAEGNLAMRSRGDSFDEQILTGGQRVAPDLLFVFQPNIDVIRHEAAHIVTKVAGDGPFTRIPSWLDEGTAVYMQNSTTGVYLKAVRFAIQTDTPLNLRSLSGQPNDPSKVNLFYGQSESMVRFLIDEFGEPAFAQLYATVKAGSTTDQALQTVYDFDINGLYNLWREDNGLPALDFAPAVDGTAAPVAEGTRAPLAIPTSVAAAPRSGADATSGTPTSDATTTSETTSTTAEDPGSSAGLIVAAVTALIVLLLVGGAIALLRRRPSDA